MCVAESAFLLPTNIKKYDEKEIIDNSADGGYYASCFCAGGTA